MNKPELISSSEFLMLSPTYDLKTFFAPEAIFAKQGIDGLMQSGLINQDQNSLIQYFDKVAVLTIDGPMRPGTDWFFSVGYGDIQNAILELLDKKEITTVIQAMRTPGGTVAQAFETEALFYELAKEKRLVSLIDMATSAGALLTFPAQERYLAGKTSETGSIGVIANHIDNRIFYKEFLGEVRTTVAKGEFKDAGTDTRGFDKKAEIVFTETVTKLHSIFADSAAKGLNRTVEEINSQESRVYIGSDGIAQGFATGFETLNGLIERFNSSQTTFFTPERPALSNIQTEVKPMDINQFKAENPDVYKAIGDEREEATKQTYIEEGKAKGILLERNRMNEIDALSLPPEFATKAKLEGLTAEKAAAEYLKTSADNRKKIADAMKKDIPNPLASNVPDMPEIPKDGEEAVAKTPKEQWEANADLRAEFGNVFERYEAFLKADAAGNIKIYKQGGK